MGVIRAGILSRVSGKVAGVVGGTWKNKAYLREYVIPANPNTTPQQVQRAKMSVGVAFGKPLVGQVFNKYTDKFERGMSGFNRFIKDNMALFLAPVTYASIKVTNGKLWPPQAVIAELAATTVTIGFASADLGNNGAGTDKIYAVVYDSISTLWHFAAAEVARSTGTIDVEVGAGTIAAMSKAYIWAAKYSVTSPTLLEMISNSVYDQVTV